MAQIRYHNFQRPLDSWAENLRLLGAITPGRICGFDSLSIVAGNTLQLSHTITGVAPTLEDGSGAGPKRGIIQSRQGVFIHEDAPVDVDVDFNVGNANDRIDLLVMSHGFLDVVGGAAANYAVIKGVLTGATEPALSNALIQVLVGRFLIKAGAATHALTIYEPIEIKGIGGYGVYSKQDEVNVKDITNSLVGIGRTVVGAQVNSDFNRVTKSGAYFLTSVTNAPSVAGDWIIRVYAKGGKIAQVAQALDSGKMYARSSGDTGATWTLWLNLNNIDAVGNLDYSSNNYVADFDNVTVAIGKLDAAIVNAVVGLLDLKGDLDCSTEPNYPVGLKGDAYYTSVAGKIGGAAGKVVAIGDWIICKIDAAAGDEATVGGSWFVMEHNLFIASQAEVNAGADDAKYITSLKLLTNLNNPEAWVDLTLINGWVNIASNKAQYRKNRLGMVEFRGAIDGGAATSAVFMNTIPNGYRGQGSGGNVIKYFPVGGATPDGVCMIKITGAGVNDFSINIGYGVSTIFHLSPIRYTPVI